MARVSIIAQLRGAKEVQRGVNDINNSLGRAQNEARALARTVTTAFATIGAAIGVREIVQAADTYKLINARILAVSDSTQEATRNTQKLFELAQKTRSLFASTALLFQRIALSRKELNRSADEILQFVENIQKLAIISGATTQEARNAIIQLSQGLASGQLRGEELRSVMEQLPAVAREIANALGLTLGKFRLLSLEGKISADQIVQAGLDITRTVERQFAGFPVTVQQALVRVQNAFIKFVGVADDASGATGAIVDRLNELAENFDTIVGPAIVVVLDLFKLLAENIREATIAAGVFLGVRFGAAFGGVGAAIGGVVGGLGAFIATMNDSSEATNRVSRELEVHNELLEEAERLETLAARAEGQLTDSILARAKALRQAASAVTDDLLAQRARLEASLNNLFQLGGDDPNAFGTGGFQKLLSDVAAVDNALRKIAETTNDNIERQKILIVLQNSVAGSFRGMESAAAKFQSQLSRTREAVEQQTSAAQKFIDALQFELSLIGKGNLQREIAINLRKLGKEATEEERQAVINLTTAIFNKNKALDQEIEKNDARLEQLKDQIAAMKSLQRLEKEDQEALEAEVILARKRLQLAGADERTRRIELRLLEDKLRLQQEGRQLTQEELAERRRAVSQIVDAEIAEQNAREAAAAIREVFNNAIEGIQGAFSNAFEDIFSGGVRTFEDFADTIKRVFIRLAAEIATLLVFRPVVGGILSGSGLGGIGQSLGLGGGFGGLGSGGVGGNLLSAAFPNGDFALSGLFDTTIFGGTRGLGVPGVAGPITGGFTVGGALSGLGLGSLVGTLFGSPQSTVGGALGGLAGTAITTGFSSIAGALGSFAGPVGAIGGGLLGSVLGGLFGSESIGPFARQNINISGGRLRLGTSGQDNDAQQLLGQLQQTGSSLVQSLNGVLDQLGLTLNDASIALIGGSNRAVQSARSRGIANIIGTSPEDVINQLLSGGFIASSTSTITNQVLRRSTAGNFQQNVSLVQGILDRIRELRNAGLSDVERALAAINGRFRELQQQAAGLGIGGLINQLRNLEFQNIRRTFAEAINREFLQLTDPIQLALQDLQKETEDRLRAARKFGLDIVKIEEVAALKRQQIIEQFSQQTTQILQTAFSRLGRGLSQVSGGEALSRAIFALQVGQQPGAPRGSLFQLSRTLIDIADASFQFGGERVFTSPSLISVAEAGPERVSVTRSNQRGAGGTVIQFNAPTVVDDISLSTFESKIERAVARGQRRVV